MSATPLEAVHAHVDALNSHDKARISATITYPFFQGLPDGTKIWMKDEGAYPPSTKGPPITIEECTEIARSTDGSFVVYNVVVDQEDDGMSHRGRRQALYAVADGPARWRVAWRQFTGYLG